MEMPAPIPRSPSDQTFVNMAGSSRPTSPNHKGGDPFSHHYNDAMRLSPMHLDPGYFDRSPRGSFDPMLPSPIITSEHQKGQTKFHMGNPAPLGKSIPPLLFITIMLMHMGFQLYGHLPLLLFSLPHSICSCLTSQITSSSQQLLCLVVLHNILQDSLISFMVEVIQLSSSCLMVPFGLAMAYLCSQVLQQVLKPTHLNLT